MGGLIVICSSSQGVEVSTEFCSLVLATGPQGTVWSYVRGGSCRVLGKGSSSEVVDMAPSLMEFKEHFDNILRRRVWVVLCEARSWTR